MLIRVGAAVFWNTTICASVHGQQECWMSEWLAAVKAQQIWIKNEEIEELFFFASLKLTSVIRVVFDNQLRIISNLAIEIQVVEVVVSYLE